MSTYICEIFNLKVRPPPGGHLMNFLTWTLPCGEHRAGAGRVEGVE